MNHRKLILFFILTSISYASNLYAMLEGQKPTSSPKGKRHASRSRRQNCFTIGNRLHCATNSPENKKSDPFIKPVYLGAIKKYNLTSLKTVDGTTHQELYAITTENKYIHLATEKHKISSTRPTQMQSNYSFPKGLNSELKKRLISLTLVDAYHAKAKYLTSLDIDTQEQETISLTENL